MIFKKVAIAAATLLALGLGNASATTTPINDSGVKTVNSSFDAIFNNTSGYTSGTLDFTLNGFKTLDGLTTKPAWTDLFTLSLNGNQIGSGYFKLGGGGTSEWLGTGSVICTTCDLPQTNTGGKATFSGVVLANLWQGNNTISFSYTSPGNLGGEGLKNESWSVTAASVTAVPEPETYAMMLAGLGLMGAIARRRQQRKAA